jgi:hypothetical protein
LTAKKSPPSLTEAPSIDEPIDFTTGNWLAADVAMSIDGRIGGGEEEIRIGHTVVRSKTEVNFFIV